jgi:hypothetical protein
VAQPWECSTPLSCALKHSGALGSFPAKKKKKKGKEKDRVSVLASNCLSLPGSWDYSCAPLCPAKMGNFTCRSTRF